MSSKFTGITLFVFFSIIFSLGYVIGRHHGENLKKHEMLHLLMDEPSGVETVGLMPLRDPVVMKEVKVTYNDIEHRFVVGVIRQLDVSRYGVRQELVLDANSTPVGEVIRRP
jgi:hypothetical protein